MKKKDKGITLVALVITIIILLILAGITISQLTGSGLFENARLAEQKTKEAQEKEDTILFDYENKIEEYVDGSRDINSIDMCSPTHIMTVGIGDNTATSTTVKGEWLFSNCENLIISTGSQYKNYLNRNEDGTWNVLKSGWYFINSQDLLSNITYDTWTYMQIKINDKFFLTHSDRKNSGTIYYSENTTVYLEKDDNIDFRYAILSNKSSITYTWNQALFSINAMSK